MNTDFLNLFNEIKNIIINEFPYLNNKIDFTFFKSSNEYFILIYDENAYFHNKDFLKLLFEIKKDILWKRSIYNVFLSYDEEKQTK